MQKRVDEYVGQFKAGYFPPLSNLARLMEESGELARELNHRFGPKKKKDSDAAKDGCSEEIGDILFTLVCLANQLNISLDESISSTFEKYQTRDKDRFERITPHPLPPSSRP